MRIKFKTKTAVNLRNISRITAVTYTLGKGMSVIGDIEKTRKFKIRGIMYDFIECEVPELDITGWVAVIFLTPEEKYVTPETVREPHYIGKNRPKTAFQMAARVQPIEKITLPEEYYAKFERISFFLDVENATAFKPTTKKTFCNIAAYQFLYQLGVFIPRVWWNTEADKKNGIVEYGKTVHEVSANGIFHWLFKRGKEFGWRVVSEKEAIECAKRQPTIAVVSRIGSGHIGLLTPHGEMWEAGRKNRSRNANWRDWVYSRNNTGSVFWTNEK